MNEETALAASLKVILVLIGMALGAALTMAIRLALGLAMWSAGPVLVAAIFSGIFAYLLVSLGVRTLLAIDAFRGALVGLAGTVAGIGVTMLIRLVAGLPAWNADPVLVVGIFTGLISYLVALGVFNYWAAWAIGSPRSDEDAPRQRGWMRYFSVDTNHKIVGIQYFVTGLTFLPFAIALQLIGRTHMSAPGLHLLNDAAYEAVISTHGIVMFFIVVLPVISGLMNYLVPLQIGAREVAFPRLNAFTFWLIPAAGLLTAFSLLAGGFDTGWTVYPPLSVSFETPAMDLILIGVYLSGISSILTAVNIITTVFTMRAPGMALFRMPIFIWTAIATVMLSLGFTQFIGTAFMEVLFSRVLGMGFFSPEKGGQPLLYQYLFWFYSHPAVYVFVLPGLGIISDIIPVFVRKPLFGYKIVAISGPGIALAGTAVFAHHMFAAGMPEWLRVPFMISTVLVAVPTGAKVFSWVASTWMGKIRLQTPVLFVFSGAMLFLVGGLTGIPQAIVPIDLYIHDTYWIVGHFHLLLFGAFLSPSMAAIYYWFPKWTGRMLDDGLGKVHWFVMTLGMSLIALPMIELGLDGMRRRIASYSPILYMQELHIATAVGGFLVFGSLGLLLWNVLVSSKGASNAGKNPWSAQTLEWMVSSPPPENNFEGIPQVLDRPHTIGIPGSMHARVTGKEEAEGEHK